MLSLIITLISLETKAQLQPQTRLLGNCPEVCDVSITFNENGSEYIVDWAIPGEDQGDDGSAEDYFAWVSPANMTAVKFPASNPVSTPIRITGGSIYVGDGSFPAGGSFLGTTFRVIVFDDDGTDGLPGTLLDSITVTVDNYEWVDFTGLDVIIEEGSYFMAMEQLWMAPNVAPVGVDTELPITNHSYTYFNMDSTWQLSAYQDFMIRPWICDVNGTRNKINNLDVTYTVFYVNNFNPCVGETPEDGMLTVLGLTTGGGWTGSIGNYAEYFAYAIVTNCGSGSYSSLVFSDAYSQLLPVEYSISAEYLDGTTPDNMVVTLDGANCAQSYFYDEPTTTGALTIPFVHQGIYLRSIIINGAVHFTSYIEITDDFHEDIVLTGIHDHKDVQQNNIKLFPNPATDVLNISSDQVIEKVSLYNCSGQKVYESTKCNTSTCQINTSKYTAGIYRISISSKHHTVNKSFVILD